MLKAQNDEKKRTGVEIRDMEIDDLAPVFHLGERLFTSKKVPTLYRTWDEYEVTNIFQTESEFCLVAEVDRRLCFGHHHHQDSLGMEIRPSGVAGSRS